jgi:hypothetical protein
VDTAHRPGLQRRDHRVHPVIDQIEMSQSPINRRVIVVCIALLVGLLHFLTGPGYRGPFPAFVNGYMIDILLPFAMYLVLGIARQSVLRSGVARGGLVFAVGATTETLQYFGVPIFGRTFDVLDYVMFGIGIGLAAAFEWVVLSRHITDPTPYPDVNAVLHALLSDVQAVLGDHFVGMYVHGSLASGDFAPQRSDVDFLVVTTDRLPDEILPALEAMHARITTSGLKWAPKLEGSYVPQQALRRYDPTQAHHPSLRVDGSFAVDHHGIDWVIQCHVIRKQGIVLAGPAPKALIDPIRPNELRWAALATLHEWWSPMLRDPTRLHSSEYRAYAVLTMCRALYTLQHGTIVSKPVAARWAQEELGERWTATIERALAWPRGAPSDDMDEMDETLGLIRYTLERSQQFEIPAPKVEEEKEDRSHR